MPIPKRGLPPLEDDDREKNEIDEKKLHYMKLFGYENKPEEFEELYEQAMSLDNCDVNEALDKLLPNF